MVTQHATSRWRPASNQQKDRQEVAMNIAVFGGVQDRPVVVPGDGEQLIAAFGGVDLDLSGLRLPESLRLSALAVMGGIKVIVPRGTDVVLSGFSLMGGRQFRPQPDRSPEGIRSVLYLNAVAIMGGVEVREAEI